MAKKIKKVLKCDKFAKKINKKVEKQNKKETVQEELIQIRRQKISQYVEDLQDHEKMPGEEGVEMRRIQQFLESDIIFGREKELEEIRNFIVSNMNILNVYGSPGLGKTSSVVKVIKQSEISSVWLNGLRLKKEKECFQNLEIDYDLMVIDEFDKISNKKGYLIGIRKYYPSIKIILISNGDINDQTIPNSENVRNLPFMPYNHKELSEIILNKLHFYGIYEYSQKIIEVASKKVLRRNGDFRKIQEIVKNLYELNLKKDQIIQEDLNVVFQKGRMQYFESMNEFQNSVWRLILKMYNESQESQKKQCNCLGLTVEELNRILKFRQGLTCEEIRQMLSEWKQMKFLRLKRKMCLRHHKYVHHIKLKIDIQILKANIC